MEDEKEIIPEQKSPEEIPQEEVEVLLKKEEEPIFHDEKKDEEAEKPINVPTPFLKRIFASFVDGVLMFFAVFGLYSLFRITPVANNLKAYQAEMREISEVLKVEAGFADKIIINKGEEGDSILHYDTDTDQYFIVKNKDFGDDTEAYQNAYNDWKYLISQNGDYQDCSMLYHLHNYAITAILSGGIVELLFFVVVPLINKERATPGQWIFKIKLMSSRYYDSAQWYDVLVRFAFIFVIESAIPYFFLAELTAVIVPVILLLICLINKKHLGLHDFVSRTYYVDKDTYKSIDE